MPLLEMNANHWVEVVSPRFPGSAPRKHAEDGSGGLALKLPETLGEGPNTGEQGQGGARALGWV